MTSGPYRQPFKKREVGVGGRQRNRERKKTNALNGSQDEIPFRKVVDQGLNHLKHLIGSEIESGETMDEKSALVDEHLKKREKPLAYLMEVLSLLRLMKSTTYTTRMLVAIFLVPCCKISVGMAPSPSKDANIMSSTLDKKPQDWSLA